MYKRQPNAHQKTTKSQPKAHQTQKAHQKPTKPTLSPLRAQARPPPRKVAPRQNSLADARAPLHKKERRKRKKLLDVPDPPATMHRDSIVRSGHHPLTLMKQSGATALGGRKRRSNGVPASRHAQCHLGLGDDYVGRSHQPLATRHPPLDHSASYHLATSHSFYSAT